MSCTEHPNSSQVYFPISSCEDQVSVNCHSRGVSPSAQIVILLNPQGSAPGPRSQCSSPPSMPHGPAAFTHPQPLAFLPGKLLAVKALLSPAECYYNQIFLSPCRGL